MKVFLDYTKDLLFKASVRDFKDFNVDEPASFHGTDLGPSAVEYLLIGIGGCLGTTFIYCLQKNNIELATFEVVVDGTLSHTGPKMLLRLANIDVDLKFTPKEVNSDEEINRCIKEFSEYCVVTNSIANGLPINVNCKKR
ncbi:MAG: OsmC family protein [Candidatus Lokiarchaeota archaeon]|nr:OsmC family protein [Candidatus Lokiarchaeota archaeon]